jgi:5-carboxymethyl-2-hydroxymuconate isomerase
VPPRTQAGWVAAVRLTKSRRPAPGLLAAVLSIYPGEQNIREGDDVPHVTVEYTDNLEPAADIPGMLRMIAARCGESGVLSLAGVRVRAIRLTEYVIADGTPEYAFVNVTVQLGKGRAPAFKKSFFSDLFDHIKAHLAQIRAARPVALSMYLNEIDEDGAFRDNGVRTALGLPQK